MDTPFDRVRARRVFEETIAEVNRRFQPDREVMVEAQATDASGATVVVARYKIYPDGRVQCFEVLDEVLWPSL